MFFFFLISLCFHEAEVITAELNSDIFQGYLVKRELRLGYTVDGRGMLLFFCTFSKVQETKLGLLIPQVHLYLLWPNWNQPSSANEAMPMRF